MRAVIQRVERAVVTVDDAVVGAIGDGFCVLIGVTHDDGERDVEVMAAKIAGLRVFPDAGGAMNRALDEVDGSLLVVSQFTLYGNVARGRRPSFTAAAAPVHAKELFDAVVSRLRDHGLVVETGVFGAMMKVEIVNDGPVTILLETVGGKLV